MKITIDTNEIVPVRALIEMSPDMVNNICFNHEEYIKRELINGLLIEMEKSGLIDFSEKYNQFTGGKTFSAEIHAFLNGIQYVTLDEFIKNASKDIRTINKMLVRPEKETDIKDSYNQPLYVGNFVKINDKGHDIYQMILPPKNGNDLPYIGGFVYENYEIKKFDVNFVYSDTLIGPELTKVKNITNSL